MIPHDILNQLLDHPPHDDDVEWNGDIIRIHSGDNNSARFRRTNYTRIDFNLSQGIAYFFINNNLVLKLAIELTLHAITHPVVEGEGEEGGETD